MYPVYPVYIYIYTRCAGIGGYWCEGHPFDFEEPLGGVDQTNNCADLMAVIKVVQLDWCKLGIRTDSRYALTGALEHRHKWRQARWMGKRQLLPNADLWAELDGLLEERPACQISFSKIRVHATHKDVRDGLVSSADFAGNAAADSLAVTGANFAQS